ncbi:MAG: Unknown protein [uncultured Aureispira sp.]|uniref:DUF547 domain-containing protein n=1 Tax=uncultured Aureispira sp. TaxID=1331704 RepID=A0A6S6SYQ4_9BACT|nr:MAG: Unknown protein [uncultured Aureispira sp.]
MKQVWFSLFLVAVFAIACSSGETAKNKTEESATSSSQTASNMEKGETVTTTTNSMEETTSNATESEHALSNSEQISGAATTTTETVATGTKLTSTTTSTQSVAAKSALSHDIFNDLLRKYVNSTGDVNYVGFKKDKAKLTAYLEVLKSNPPQSNWSKNKEMAYWINLYNAFTIYAIVEKYPINSVMNLEDGKLWDKKTIVIDGESLSLNKIEKDKLLKRFKEPRVHFAVNCGAISCPPLLNKAWTEDNIQRYYDKQVRAFINNPKHNTISIKNLEASQIFDWYAGDFGGSDKVVAYFQKYSTTELQDNPKVRYREYNWKLNKQ